MTTSEFNEREDISIWSNMCVLQSKSLPENVIVNVCVTLALSLT